MYPYNWISFYVVLCLYSISLSSSLCLFLVLSVYVSLSNCISLSLSSYLSRYCSLSQCLTNVLFHYLPFPQMVCFSFPVLPQHCEQLCDVEGQESTNREFDIVSPSSPPPPPPSIVWQGDGVGPGQRGLLPSTQTEAIHNSGKYSPVTTKRIRIDIFLN